VLGMDATNGIPTAIVPLAIPMDPEILRLEQIARGGLQPRITNIAFHAVPIQAGGNVLIVRVPAATIRRTASSAKAVIGFGHARLPENMSRTSMSSGRFSMLAPNSRTASATSASTALLKSRPGKPRFN
jgi:hypothetical protein